MNPLIRRVPGVDGLFAIRSWLGFFHVLIKGDEVVLVDTGMWGEMGLVRRLLKAHGLSLSHVKAILLTHGHLDHAGNVAFWAKESSAKIYAHSTEQSHIDGTYPYEGITKWCDGLERIGRRLFSTQSAPIDCYLDDEAKLPFWGGLEVVHLPGHTIGHCGFYSAKHRLLFTGDLFSSYFYNTSVPPSFLNSCPNQFEKSFDRVRQINPKKVMPNHYDQLNPELHSRRFLRHFRAPHNR